MFLGQLDEKQSDEEQKNIYAELLKLIPSFLDLVNSSLTNKEDEMLLDYSNNFDIEFIKLMELNASNKAFVVNLYVHWCAILLQLGRGADKSNNAPLKAISLDLINRFAKIEKKMNQST